MDWIASLWSSPDFWEVLEYVAEAIVIVSAAIEFLTEFEHILKGDGKKELRHRVGKYAAIGLILGLGVELGALVRTNQLFTKTIASLYRQARDANNRATDAGTMATEAIKRADGEAAARLNIEESIQW